MHKKLVFPLMFVLDPGHEHSYTESTTDPTCTEAGYTIYTCSCGDSYTVDLPALGHDYVLVNQSGNVATYECSRCGHRYTAIVPVDPQPPVEYSLRSSTATTEHHEYIYASGRLMRETVTTTANGTSTTEVLDFIYGSGSTPLALVYTNGTASPVTYYYVTNIQGDVVKLVTASGTTVASYTYDAWGKVLSAEGDMAEVNPIRYRGYYYDAETELYYLQSRYYDPEVRRFVNADALASTGQGFTGYNMFAYCLNCPTIMADHEGFDAILVIDYVLGEGGLLVVGHARLYVQDEDGNWYVTEYTGSNKSNARVVSQPVDQDSSYYADLCTILLARNGAGLESGEFLGNDYVYIVGDFSESQKAAKSFNGNPYNSDGYNLIFRNCLHYAKDILMKGEFESDYVRWVAASPTPVPKDYYNALRSAVNLSSPWIKAKKFVKGVEEIVKGIFD